jgi:hypothetical protein
VLLRSDLVWKKVDAKLLAQFSWFKQLLKDKHDVAVVDCFLR